MARGNLPRFDSVIETRMQQFFPTLSEKDQRRYAAVEAERLGHGGIEYISDVLGVLPILFVVA